MSPSGPELPDAEARRRISLDLDATVFVEAAAGTGKTTVLVARLVSILQSGRARLDRVVAVTFTEKAAGEMKLRLRAEIERVRADETTSAVERDRLRDALAQLELARIGTIHGFCSDLIRERPVESGVDPLFEVAAEDEQRALLDRAFESWFQRTLADPPPGVRRVLRRRQRGPASGTPKLALRNAVANLLEHRDFTAAWRRDPFERDAGIDRVIERLREVGALAARANSPNDYLARSLAEIQRFVAETDHREAVRPRDYDGLEAALRELPRHRHWRWRGFRSTLYGPDLPRDEVRELRDRAKVELDAFVEAADADLAPRLREELRPVIGAYEALKGRAGRLDFLDLLLCARNLVREQREVRAELQQRFTHYFVDEFQDTDPLQAELLLLLAADDPAQEDWSSVTPVPGKLFLVGDPKQSIYRFRRADVEVYQSVKEILRARGAVVVNLTTSFRSVPAIQSAVNAAFEPAMSGGAQADYVPLERFRPDASGRPALIALPVPRPYVDYGNRAMITNYQIEQSFPDAVGAYVDWLVNQSGWTIAERDRPAELVPIEPRHVCILFRRFRQFRADVTRPYVRALEVRRVPHVLVGGRSFHDREEVLAIRNALCAIEWPDDELRVFATLRGPFFALGDDALLAFRHQLGRLHTLRRLELGALDEPLHSVGAALAILGRLHVARNHRPIADTIGRFLQSVRAHAGIAIWPTGEQALANCLRVIDLARRFERGGASSFRAFVERMEEDAERGESEEAPAVEEGTEGVRIMTVHRAKGLEFPVVILADPTCRATREVPMRHVDVARGVWVEELCGCAPPELLEAREEEGVRDHEEAVRLTYVAATRARDLLVVPVIGDERGDRSEGWLDVLDPSIYPERKGRRTSDASPGCPEFGEDSLLERPESAERGPRASVAPGRHAPQAGAHDVTWWDPRALELDREETVGLRQEQILTADEGEVAADEGVRAHERWQETRRRSIEHGELESIRVRAVTTLAESGAGDESAAVAVEQVSADRSGRPAGPRFGTLVHATLAAVDLTADAAAIRAAAAAQAQLLGSPPDEVDAAITAVRSALAHPLLQRASRASSLRRETPVMLRLPDGSLAEGVIDLAFRDASNANGAAWTVVDFKTDRDLEARRPEYEAQVRLYVEAVASATGEPAEGALLVV